MKIFSPAFENGKQIPVKYTKNGGNITPPLLFRDIPKKTKSIAIIVEDPGGPLIKFIHWVVWNIPPNIREISEGEKVTYPQGKNSLLKRGYLGPCPPYGKHKYFFNVYALDTMLDIKPNSSRKKLEKAMSNHIIEKSSLIGIYKK